ncbi:hypothetical protein AB0F42_34180 [Streptomyces buecherae]|uniref:hypothetical protein n=1 Tax=Streptomyces buecherae TaxID=2763006 RepID=UPI0033E6510A
MALISLAFTNIVGIGMALLFGSLAVTFAIIGLRNQASRCKCVIGLTFGALPVLYFLFLIASFG